jgi:hypothetical protein
VNVLRKLREVLVPGGLLIDTQPVSQFPAVRTRYSQLGAFDATEWRRTIDRVDRRRRRAIGEGLFKLVHRRRLIVIEQFDAGDELLGDVREWAGTAVEPALARRIAKHRDRIWVQQHVTLRVLKA